MAGSLNEVKLIGNVGADPEIKNFQNGGRCANLSIATSETWKDKNTGEKKEKTEWHRVVCFNEGLTKVIESYVNKGSKIYIQGQLETRSWEQDGQKKYTTEIVLRPFNSGLLLLDSRNSGGGNANSPAEHQQQQQPASTGSAGLPAPSEDDEIPF